MVSKKSSAKNSILSQESMTHSLSYIPYFIGPIVMFFLADTNKKKLLVHVKYSAIIAWAVIILTIMLNVFFAYLLHVVYIWLSLYLWYTAYNGENIQIDFIDTLEDKVYENIKK